MNLPLGKGDAFLLGLLKIEQFAQRVRAGATCTLSSGAARGRLCPTPKTLA